MTTRDTQIQFQTDNAFNDAVTAAAKERGLGKGAFVEMLCKEAFERLIPVSQIRMFYASDDEVQGRPDSWE